MVRLFPARVQRAVRRGMLEQIEHDYDRARARGSASALWFSLEHGARSRAFGNRGASGTRLGRARSHRLRRRSEWSWTMHEWMQDLRHAARSLKRSPGFTAVDDRDARSRDRRERRNVQRRQYGAAESAAVRERRPARHDRRDGAGLRTSPTNSASRRSSSFNTRSSRSCSRTSRRSTRSRRRCAPATASSAFACRVPTNSLFSTLGAKPILGRLPVAADEDQVVVISYALWKSWFNGDSSVIGKRTRSSGDNRTVDRRDGTGFQVSERRHDVVDLERDPRRGHRRPGGSARRSSRA